MISDTTMKAIKKFARYHRYNDYTYKTHKIRFSKFAINTMKFAVMLDNVGWPVHKIYNTGKMKTDLCKSIDERIDLSECAIEIFNKLHLEISFMSNGTYIK